MCRPAIHHSGRHNLPTCHTGLTTTTSPTTPIYHPTCAARLPPLTHERGSDGLPPVPTYATGCHLPTAFRWTDGYCERMAAPHCLFAHLTATRRAQALARPYAAAAPILRALLNAGYGRRLRAAARRLSFGGGITVPHIGR